MGLRVSGGIPLTRMGRLSDSPKGPRMDNSSDDGRRGARWAMERGGRIAVPMQPMSDAAQRDGSAARATALSICGDYQDWELWEVVMMACSSEVYQYEMCMDPYWQWD